MQRHPEVVKTKGQLVENEGRSQKLGAVECWGRSSRQAVVQLGRVFLGDAASHLGKPLTMPSEDAECSSRPGAVPRSCSSGPSRGLMSALADRW